MSLMITNHGSVGTADCPPDGMYTLEFASYGTPEQRPAFNDPNKTVLRMEVVFVIRDAVDDLDEEDAATWIGREIRDWVTIPKDLNNERAKLGLMLKALLNKKEFGIGENVDLNDAVGQTMRASIKVKENGWPQIDGYAPIRRKKPAPKPAPPVADDEDDWDEGE